MEPSFDSPPMRSRPVEASPALSSTSGRLPLPLPMQYAAPSPHVQGHGADIGRRPTTQCELEISSTPGAQKLRGTHPSNTQRSLHRFCAKSPIRKCRPRIIETPFTKSELFFDVLAVCEFNACNAKSTSALGGSTSTAEVFVTGGITIGEESSGHGRSKAPYLAPGKVILLTWVQTMSAG